MFLKDFIETKKYKAFVNLNLKLCRVNFFFAVYTICGCQIVYDYNFKKWSFYLSVIHQFNQLNLRSCEIDWCREVVLLLKVKIEL